jgi:hypothetical protein
MQVGRTNRADWFPRDLGKLCCTKRPRCSGGGNDLNRILDLAKATPGQFPLLPGIDAHDDASFTVRQGERLLTELDSIRGIVESQLTGTVDELVSLLTTFMLPGGGHNVGHRRLDFIGG